MSRLQAQKAGNAIIGLLEKSLPEQLQNAIKKIVAVRGVEPREGFVANELSVLLPNGIEVSVEGRARRGQVCIVRWNGNVVAHGFHGFTDRNRAWMQEIQRATEEIWHDEMEARADTKCATCKGYGVRLDEGEYLPCDCTERQQPTFAVIHGANQQQSNFKEVAEELAA